MPVICGLDLGQTLNPAAFVVLNQEHRWRHLNLDDWGVREKCYEIKYAKRLPKRTPYTSTPAPGGGWQEGIVQRVARLLEDPRLAGCTLVIDQTGVGRAGCDIFRAANLPCRIVPLTITAGASISSIPADGSYHVPKAELVTCLEIILQQDHLTVARGTDDGEALYQELHSFTRRITRAGNEVSGAEAGAYDDLVLAICIAAWFAENVGVGPAVSPNLVVYNAPALANADMAMMRATQAIKDALTDPHACNRKRWWKEAEEAALEVLNDPHAKHACYTDPAAHILEAAVTGAARDTGSYGVIEPARTQAKEPQPDPTPETFLDPPQSKPAPQQLPDVFIRPDGSVRGYDMEIFPPDE